MLDPRGASGSRGQALPLIAFAVVCILGLASLVADLGYWRYEQRMEQGAADSGAIAGANALPYATASSSPSPVKTLAQMDAASNGFTDGAGGVTVQVNNPPASGPNAGNTSAVEVIVKKPQPSFFGGIFGKRNSTVSGRAVALRGTANRNCLTALDTSNTGINFNNATVYMPQCGIMSDSSFLANGSNVTATSVGYVPPGTNQNVWGNTYLLNGSATSTPAPAAHAADPCPTLPGCAYIKANPPTSLPLQTPGPSGWNFNVPSSGLTMNPGKYPQPINFNGGGGTLTFLPGTYDFEGGANFNSGISEIDGSDVTFFVNGSSFNINSGVMKVSAPSSGNYIGMLIYSTTINNFNINSGSPGNNGSFAGGIYLPSATFILDGGLSTWVDVIAKDIILNSNSRVNVPSSAFPGVTTKPATLVE